MLKHCLNVVFFPVVVVGFVYDIFSSFFEYGSFLATRWLNEVMRDPAAVAKAEADALAHARKMFPNAQCRVENGSVIVEQAPATQKKRRALMAAGNDQPAGNRPVLTDDYTARKAIPLFSGVLRYFPDALAAVAELSRVGNEQHNPGKPLHWDRSKSGDELDALTRHLLDAGTMDIDNQRHSTKVAWRALANLQKEIEAAKK